MIKKIQKCGKHTKESSKEQNSGGATLDELCPEHSGFKARIIHVEQKQADMEDRLRSVEVMVYKASGITGFVMGLVVVAIQHFWK